jgi:hypothetical protein
MPRRQASSPVPASRRLARTALLCAAFAPLAGCAIFGAGAQSPSSSDGALSRLRGDGTNHLQGDVVWAGRKAIRTPQEIHGKLIDADGKAMDRAVDCSIQACTLSGTGAGWSVEGLASGRYIVELRSATELIASVDVKLISVPTLGGKTALVPDPTPHVGKLETVFTQRKVWLPRDKRAPKRQLAWMWLKDGEFVSVQSAEFGSDDIEGPLLEYVPTEVRNPVAGRLSREGKWELLLFWSDAKEPIAHFDVDFPKAKEVDLRAMGKRTAAQVRADQAAEPPPWTIDAATPAPDVSVKVALAHMPKGAPPPKPHSEMWACAVALDADAGKAAHDQKRVHDAIFKLEQRAGYAMEEARETARVRAALQGRELTTRDENGVNDMMESSFQGLGLPAQLSRLRAKYKELAARIDQAAAKQPPGCMASALPDELRDGVTAPGAPH